LPIAFGDVDVPGRPPKWPSTLNIAGPEKATATSQEKRFMPTQSEQTPSQAAPKTANGPRIRICLAGSGGGHVRQLLDLQPLWSKHDYFFVTEDTALGQSLRASHRTYLVPHFAWGQAKLGAPFRMLGAAVVSFFRSAAIIMKERPSVIISTGAGAVFFAVIWAKLIGSRVVVIESFARFERPSLFGRLAAPLADDLVVQSPNLSAAYPKAHVFDPMRRLETTAPPKQQILFATVGATLPFDRLVESVAQLRREGEIPERIIIQTGIGGLAPDGLSVIETMPFGEVQTLLRDAAIVVCHGGTGSLITALREGCQVIAMPRLAVRGEHYDDHQAEITSAFERRGLVLVANTVDELREALRTARTREPVLATSDPSALIEFLHGVIAAAKPARA
jgi:UDP-N-acetylglucosamine--N-acetylmuramyl-(pentapeptide) pyrophosphoryl-undecaprenol N-acetylglucosamine transferase